jgi:dihydrofolate reductase
MISLIVAMAENRVIGGDNKLLWHIPEDLKRFKALTTGKPIIMGRKTYDSIGRPLPNRPNIVITRQAGWTAPGVTVVGSLEDAVKTAENMGSDEIMVIGGAQIYSQALQYATRVYLTHIHKAYDGDARFPELPATEWMESDRQAGAEDFYEFITYQRK